VFGLPFLFVCHISLFSKLLHRDIQGGWRGGAFHLPGVSLQVKIETSCEVAIPENNSVSAFPNRFLASLCIWPFYLLTFEI